MDVYPAGSLEKVLRRLQVDERFAHVGDVGADGFLELGAEFVRLDHRQVAVHEGFQCDEELALYLMHLNVVRFAQTAGYGGATRC